MYVQNDPRASLADTNSEQEILSEWFFDSQLCLFYDSEPQISDENGRTWISRGQNFVIAYSETDADAAFTRTAQPDEYAVIVPDPQTKLEVTTEEDTITVPGHSILFVPPGTGTIRVVTGGRIVRLFTPRSQDLAVLASNAEAFQGRHPNVPPFEPWPDPVGGLKPRWYSLNVPEDPSRFGRIYRCTTFMINFLNPRSGPRARDQVSPHHHDDFEQCSLALDGAFTHHLRWPWTTNMNNWRDDKHLFCQSPSVCIIPPPAFHTTTAEADGTNQLVDIFSPPRKDFSLKPGWVLNEADYPMPD